MPGRELRPGMHEEKIMANDLNGVSSGYAQGLSQYSPGLPEKVAETKLPSPPQAQRASGETEVRINITNGSFPALSDSKDAAAQVAQSVRNVNGALDKADALLTKMEAQVGLVKNYPPFPAGNEDRVKYLNSIDGLRQQLQSLVIPPVKDGNAPVFYPQEEKFPPLDPDLPSDAAVLAFGEAVKAVKEHLGAGRLTLQAQAEKLSAGGSIEVPQLPTESQAQGISEKVAVQLAGTRQSLVGSTDVLAQLKG